MAIGRDDRYITDAQGRALAGVAVYYCTQPANTSTIPPSPLATVYTNNTGTVGSNPVYTDGYGHSVAYLQDTQLYTLVCDDPLFFEPLVLIDQTIPGTGGGGTSYTPFGPTTPSGTVDGANRVFTVSIPGNPVSLTVVNNYVLTQGVGYTASWSSGTLTITYAFAPSPGDTLSVQGWY
jgi:hypothetical protein